MKRIDDLCKVWPNEATNFTKLFAEEEKLEELGKAVGFDINLEERKTL